MAVKARKSTTTRQYQFAVLLCRASKGSNDRSEGMVTLEVQEAEMKAWCKVKGLEVLRVFHEDGRSGYKPGTKRPDYEEAVALAKEVGAVLVTYYLDRLTRRGVAATLNIITELDQAGAGYASIKEDFTTTGPMGEVLVAFAAALARMESDKKSERASDVHLAKAEAGEYVGGPRPYGYEWDYTSDADGKPRRIRGTMHVVEPEAEVLREAARRILEGESQSKIVADFNRRQVPTVLGGEWRHQTLRKVLVSPTIAGCREIDGFGLIGTGKWPAILDRATYETVRANYEGRKNADHSTARRWMLSGLITCSCGGVVRSKFHSKGKRYACVECGVSINAAAADNYVTERLLAALPPAMWNHLRSATKANVAIDIAEQATALRDALVAEWITPAEFRQSMEALHEKARPVEPAPDLPSWEDLQAEFPEADVEDKALIVGRQYPVITLHPGNGSVAERLVLEGPHD